MDKVDKCFLKLLNLMCFGPVIILVIILAHALLYTIWEVNWFIPMIKISFMLYVLCMLSIIFEITIAFIVNIPLITKYFPK